MVVAAVLAVPVWALVGILGVAGSRIVERLWLASGWGWAGVAVYRWRRGRWSRAATAAEVARSAALSGPAGEQTGHVAEFRAQSRRRNRVGLAEPQRPGWMSDRIAALESRVEGQYGIDLPVVWPRLWLILPGPVKADLRLARAVWLNATTWAWWGVLFSILGAIWWPSLVPGAVLLGWGWARGRTAIGAFADLAEAAVDLYATDLADVLGVALSGDGRVDHQVGQSITSLVRKGA